MLDIIVYILSYDIFFYVSHLYFNKIEYYYIHKRHHSFIYNKMNYKDIMKGEIIKTII